MPPFPPPLLRALREVGTWDGEPVQWDGEEPNLALDAPGDYRLRVHVRGRDAGKDADTIAEDENPVESHLMQIWPADAQPDALLLTGDEVGAYWRGE